MRHRIELGFEVPSELVHDVAAKMVYVSDRITGLELDRTSRSIVAFDFPSDDGEELERIAGNIRKVASGMCANYRTVPVRVIERVGDGQFATTNDPHPELLQLGELVEFGPGRYGFGNRLTRLIRRLDDICLEYAVEFDASHRQYPAIIGADVMDTCNYLRSCPHSLCLVSHLREDLDGIAAFAREAKWADGRLSIPNDSLDDAKVLLAPSVCFHCYAGLSKSRLSEPLTITAVGKCFRYESGNLSGLERLWDFTMREVIFVGDREFVLHGRDASIGSVVRILRRLGLQFTIETASDPFFIDVFTAQSTFQKLFDLKYEIRAALPYAGRTLAVGSFNYHQDFFGRAFEITAQDYVPAHTGCVAFGLERLALAIVAQHGVDPMGWPNVLRDA